MQYLFVYGTLRRSFDNQYAILLRQSSTFVGEARVAGDLRPHGPYTALIPDPQSTNFVHGEVFRITDPDRLWPVLDEYEGVDYERRTFPISLNAGNSIEAFIYILRG